MAAPEISRDFDSVRRGVGRRWLEWIALMQEGEIEAERAHDEPEARGE